MRLNQGHRRHCRPTTRDRQLAGRARCVAETYSAVEAAPFDAPFDLLAYAGRVVDFEDAWGLLLETLGA